MIKLEMPLFTAWPPQPADLTHKICYEPATNTAAIRFPNSPSTAIAVHVGDAFVT